MTNCHSDLFDGSKSGSPSIHPPTQLIQSRRRAEHIWTERDDALLKAAFERYPNNWALICEAFNSSRLTISTDKRLPGDCFERWLALREAGEIIAPRAF
jgi:chromatin modification-related protein VID21